MEFASNYGTRMQPLSSGVQKDVGSRKASPDENFSVAKGIIPKKACLV